MSGEPNPHRGAWRSWRWWLALILIPVAYSQTTAEYYDGQVPTARPDAVAYVFDVILRYGFYVVIAVGIPSLVLRVVRPGSRPPQVGFLGHAVLAAALLLPMFVLVADT